MTEDDLQQLQAARERGLARAREFFESLTPEQVEALKARAKEIGEGRCPPIDREEMGADYERNGWMPKADYLEMERIVAGLQAGRPTAERDFETMLRLLGESKETIVRARILAFLGELVKRDAPGPGWVTRIETAITPWRASSEHLDILYWGFVREALDGLVRARCTVPGS